MNGIQYSRVFSDQLPPEGRTGREIYAYIYRLVYRGNYMTVHIIPTYVHAYKFMLFWCLYQCQLHASCSESKISNLTAEVHQEQISQYVGGENFQGDVFFRPPFVARVQVNTTAVPELECMPEFALIGIHTKPVQTYSELNGLVNVYDRRTRVRGINENALILGDFNADCGTFGPGKDSEHFFTGKRTSSNGWLRME